MHNFVIKNELLFVAFSPKIDPNTNEKEYPSLLKDWKRRSFNYLNDLYKYDKTATCLMICPDDKFIIFDTDTEEVYNRLSDGLKKMGLYNEDNITKSTRGHLYSYKRHFWFKVSDDKFKNLSKHHLYELEVFIGRKAHIAELKDSTLSELQTLTYENYIAVKNMFKTINKEEKKPSTNTPPLNDLYNLCSKLDKKRFILYDYWISIYMVFVNHKLDIEIFKYFSKLHYTSYDEDKNNKVLSTITEREGYSLATLYYYLKEDDPKYYKSILPCREDLNFLFLKKKDQYSLAKLFFSLNPTKYLRSKTFGWYESKKNNIYIHSYDEPSSLLNNISEQLSQYIDEFKDSIIRDEKYAVKLKTLDSLSNKIGSYNFAKGICKYLKDLYTNEEIVSKIDSNPNLFAFNNILYDNEIKEFRNIRPEDYISKTTGYELNLTSNPKIRAHIEQIIKSMFDSEEIYNYHLQTIALSMFGNKNESFYINSGSGRNGKGVCSSFIEKAFGNYFYQGGSTFYTTVFNEDKPNSTLFNLKGIRYFLTSEPENDSDSKFNIGMLKVTTGSDTITTRDLNKSNISYRPFFTPFVQCNKKPKIDNFEDAIKRRFKIIHFPYCFVDNPTKPNEKQIDINLKSQINQEYYNEFMLMIIDISKNNDNVKIPKEVLGNVDQYINQNNSVMEFLQDTFDFIDDDKERIRTSDLLQMFNQSGDYNYLSPVKFAQALEMNKIRTKKFNAGKYVLGIKLKDIPEEI